MQGGALGAPATACLAGFEDRGYAVIPTLLEAGSISALRSVVETLHTHPESRSRRGSVYGVRSALHDVSEVRELGAVPPISTLVDSRLGPGSVLVRAQFFDKTPEANWKVPWHQDLTIAVRERREAPGFRVWTMKEGIPHVQPPIEVLERMLIVRVHLDSCPPENGPLLVLPGTHSLGRLAPEDIRRLRERVPPETCAAEAGGVVLIRPLLLHASGKAESPGHRRVLHLEFATGSLPGGLQWLS